MKTRSHRPLRLEGHDIPTFTPKLAIIADPVQHIVPVWSIEEIGRRRFGEDDGAPDRVQRCPLGSIGLAVGGYFTGALWHIQVATVELQIVDSPRGEKAGVLKEVIVAAAVGLAAAGISATGLIACVFIDTELQSQLMYRVGYRSDTVRKSLWIELEVAGGVTRFLHPAIVDGDGVVAACGKVCLY